MAVRRLSRPGRAGRRLWSVAAAMLLLATGTVGQIPIVAGTSPGGGSASQVADGAGSAPTFTPARPVAVTATDPTSLANLGGTDPSIGLTTGPLLAKAPPVPTEVVGARTEFSRTIANPDGTYALQVGQGRVNYLGPNGNWQPLDLSLVSATSGNFDLQVKASDRAVRFSDGTGDTALASLGGNGHTIALRALGYGAASARPPGSNVVQFPGAPGQGGVFVRPTDTGFEFGATLADPSQASTYTFALDPGDLTASLATDGQTIELTDAAGTVLGTISPPNLVDGAGAPANETHPVTVTLTAQSGTPNPAGAPTPSGSPAPSDSPTPSGSPAPSDSPTPSGSPDPAPTSVPSAAPSPTAAPTPAAPNPAGLTPAEVLVTYQIDPVWLAAADRVFPVTLDPDACIGAGASGCDINSSTAWDYFIESGLPDNYPSGWNVTRVGYDTRGWGYASMRSLQYFGDVALPDGAQVISGTLNAKISSEYGPAPRTPTMAAYRVTTNWTEGSETWNQFNGGYTTSSASPALAIPAAGSWMAFNVTSIARQFYTRRSQDWVSNVGFLLKESSESSSYGDAEFYRYNDSTTANRPYLDVAYVLPAVQLNFDPALGANYSPSHMVAGQVTRLPISVTDTGSIGFNAADGSDHWRYQAGYRWIDEKGNAIACPEASGHYCAYDLPATINAGTTSAVFAISVTPPSSPGQYTLRLDLVHSLSGVPQLWASDWASPGLFYSRDKRLNNSDNTRWTGSSVIERDEFQINVTSGGGGQGPLQTVKLGDGSTLAVNLDSQNLRLSGGTGLGFGDLGGAIGLTYGYDSANVTDCASGATSGGLLEACGWYTNWDERITNTTGTDYTYQAASGDRYAVSTDGNGVLNSTASVLLARPRMTLFDENPLGTGATSGVSVMTAASQSIPTYSGSYVIKTNSNTSSVLGTSEPVNINQDRLVSFAVRSTGATGVGVDFKIHDITTNTSFWFIYVMGTAFTTAFDHVNISGTLANNWLVVAQRSLYDDVKSLHGTIYDNYEVVAWQTTTNGASSGSTYLDDVRFEASSHLIFDDSNLAWTSNSGITSLNTTDHVVGTASIQVNAATLANSPWCDSQSGHTCWNGGNVWNMTAWPFASWYWKKVGGSSVAMGITMEDQRTPAVFGTFYYYAGAMPAGVPFTCGSGGNQACAIQVSNTIPTSWTKVTRDIVDDARQVLGFFNNSPTGSLPSAPPSQGPSPDTILWTAIKPSAVDGTDALFDDMSATNARDLGSPSQYGQLTGDEFTATSADGSVHHFNRDGLLTAITDPNGNTTTVTWSVSPASVTGIGTAAQAGYALTTIAAPSDNAAVSGGTARREIAVTKATNSPGTGLTTTTFTEQLGTTTSATGRSAAFSVATATASGTITYGIGDLVYVDPARNAGAACNATHPTGCTEISYTATTGHFILEVRDPRWNGTTIPGNPQAMKDSVQYSGVLPYAINDDSTNASLLYIPTFDRTGGTGLYQTPIVQTASERAADAGNDVQLSPDGNLLNTYQAKTCATNPCTNGMSTSYPAAAASADLLSSQQFDGLAQVSETIDYRTPDANASITRQGSQAAARVDNLADPLKASEVAWTQSAEQYAASVATGNPDAYRTFAVYGSNLYQPTDVITPHANGQAASYANAISGAAGYWRLGESSGTTFADSSGNGHSGTLSGTVTKGQPGALPNDANTAMTFDGATGYGSVSGLTISGSFTAEAWVKPATTAGIMTFLGSRGPSADYGFKLDLQYGTTLHIDIGDGTKWLTNVDTALAYVAGQWYHVVVTVTTAGWVAYANGQLIATGALATPGTPLLADANHNLYLGQSGHASSPQYFNGTIDEVAVYAATLAPATITAHLAAAYGFADQDVHTTYDANGNPLTVSDDAFVVNPGMESGANVGWTTASGTATIDGTKQTGGLYSIKLNNAGAQTSYVQSIQLLPGQTFQAQAQAQAASGSTATLTVTYQKKSDGNFYTLGSLNTTSTSWVAVAGLFTIPAGDATGVINLSLITPAANTAWFDDVSLFSADRAATYNANGTVATSTDATNVVTQNSYVASSSVPAIFATTTTANVGGSGGANVANVASSATYDVWGRVVSATDPDGVTTTTVYKTAGNGIQTDVASSADDLGNTTTYLYDAVGNRTAVTPPNGAAETTTTTYDLGDHALTVNPPGDASGHQSVTTNTYNAYGQLSQTATDSSGANVVTTLAYDAYGQPTTVVADSGGIAATTSTTYDLAGNVVSRTVCASGCASGSRTTWTLYDNAGQAVATQAPLAPGSGSAAPTCPNQPAGLPATRCDSLATIAFDGTTSSTIDAYGKPTVASYNFAGHAVRTIQNDITGTYNPTYPDQDLVTTAAYDLLGHATSATDTLGDTTFTTYDTLGRATKVKACDSTCTTYTWTRTDYTPAGRTWKVSRQGDNTNDTGDAAVAWTETRYDADGRPVATLANYDVTGTGDTWGGQTYAGTFLESFEASSTDWSTATDTLLPNAPAGTALDTSTSRTGLTSESVTTSASALNSGIKWLLSVNRIGSFTFQGGHSYHLHANVIAPSGHTLQAFLGTTGASCQSSNLSTNGSWQAIDCTWTPGSSQTSGVEAVIRQGDASASQITVHLDDVQVFESTSAGAPLNGTPTNVAASVSVYDAEGRVLRSTLPPGHLAKDGTITDTGIPVTTTTYDNLGRPLTVTVNATAGTSGSFPSLVRGTPGLVADYRLNEPASSTTAADLVAGSTATVGGTVTFGVTGALANSSLGPVGSSTAATFDGSTGYAATTTAATSATNNFAMAAWFNLTSTGAADSTIAYNGTDSGGWGLAISSSGHLGARFGGVSFLDTGVSPTTGAWHLAVVVRNAGTTTIYLDNAQAGSTWTTTPNSPAAAFSIGREDGSVGRYFKGSIDEVGVFKQALASSQIGALYQAGSGSATAAANLTTAYAYDALGHKTDVMDPSGIVTHDTYDHLGRIVSGIVNYLPGDGAVTAASQNVTALAAYDAVGEAIATCSGQTVVGGCTSANISTSNLAWRYNYDKNGHEVGVETPLNGTLTGLASTGPVYDAAQQRVADLYTCPSNTLPGGTACSSYLRDSSMTYDQVGRLTVTTLKNASGTTQATNTTTYDGLGRPVSQAFVGTVMGEGTDTITTVYDGLGRPSTLSRNGTQQTGWTHDPDGTVKTRTDNLVSTTASSFTYDSLGRQVTAYSPLFGSTSNTVAFSWRLDGLIDTRAPFGGPTATTFAYDGAKRPVSACEGTCSGSQVDVERTYDRSGNAASEIQSLSGANTNQNGTQTFTYDALDRVTGATLGAISKSYTYDADSNRRTSNDQGVTSTFTYDTTDEVIKDNYASTDHAFTYDAYGNRVTESVSDGGSAAATTYTYDLADRMTKAAQSDGITTVNFTFDALGRHGTRATGTGTLTTIDTYGYEGASDSVAQDVENQASVTVNAAIDALGDRLVSGTSSAYAWLIPDLHGNVIGQLNSTGSTVTDAFRYDAYGLTEGTTLTGSVPSPWRFQGKLLESTGGSRDLYDFVARSYAPDLAAFTQLDSVAGSAQNPLTLNRYLYAAANPETLIDPSGHDTCHYGREDCDAIAAAQRQAAQQQARQDAAYQAHLCSRYGECGRPDPIIQVQLQSTHDHGWETLSQAQQSAIDDPILAQMMQDTKDADLYGPTGPIAAPQPTRICSHGSCTTPTGGGGGDGGVPGLLAGVATVAVVTGACSLGGELVCLGIGIAAVATAVTGDTPTPMQNVQEDIRDRHLSADQIGFMLGSLGAGLGVAVAGHVGSGAASASAVDVATEDLPAGIARQLGKLNPSGPMREAQLLGDGNYLLTVLKPANNIPGSYAIYAKLVTPDGNTLEIDQYVFDERGDLLGIDHKYP